MRRLSDVPWTSQRPPSSPSCQRWHTCGRRRAPRCRRKTSHLFPTNFYFAFLPHSKRLCGHVSALCLAVGRDDPECAKQKNQQVLKHDVDGCDNMLIRKRPVNRRAASQRARWQPETNNQISAIFFFWLAFILSTGSVMLMESKRVASFSGPKIPPGIWEEGFVQNLSFAQILMFLHNSSFNMTYFVWRILNAEKSNYLS